MFSAKMNFVSTDSAAFFHSNFSCAIRAASVALAFDSDVDAIEALEALVMSTPLAAITGATLLLMNLAIWCHLPIHDCGNLPTVVIVQLPEIEGGTQGPKRATYGRTG